MTIDPTALCNYCRGLVGEIVSCGCNKIKADKDALATEFFKIEKGIPLPEKRGSYADILSKLDVGDSILTPISGDGRTTVFHWAIQKLRKLEGREFAVRKVNEESVRVWRTK